MSDFVPAFTDEEIYEIEEDWTPGPCSIYAHQVQSELKRCYAHIKLLEKENRIIKESATILFNERNRDGERLVKLEALNVKANKVIALYADVCLHSAVNEYLEAAKELDNGRS